MNIDHHDDRDGQADSPLLDVADLHVTFHTPRGTVAAVQGVSLTVPPGTTLGVVGESGSGKTVLARAIMGLLPGANVERRGRVVFGGRVLTDLSPAELRHVWGAELAMVFQDPMTALNPVVKVGRQVTEPLRFHTGTRPAEARAIATALLSSVRIPEPERRLGEYPHQLSGGMRQRVAVAMALACGPRLLIADEPTTALDVTVQAQILELLRQQRDERHMALILITHDLGVAAGHTDEIAVMYAGQVVEKAPTRTLFSGMKMPYTEALVASIPNLEDPSHTRLRAIEGRPPDLTSLPAGCRFAPRCPYARDRCHAETPPLRQADRSNHLYRCWYPLGAPVYPTGGTLERVTG